MRSNAITSSQTVSVGRRIRLGAGPALHPNQVTVLPHRETDETIAKRTKSSTYHLLALGSESLRALSMLAAFLTNLTMRCGQ